MSWPSGLKAIFINRIEGTSKMGFDKVGRSVLFRTWLGFFSHTWMVLLTSISSETGRSDSTVAKRFEPEESAMIRMVRSQVTENVLPVLVSTMFALESRHSPDR